MLTGIFTALKYHPDRNRGRETEFNSKFQAIQAAHEILGEPQQRLKYDTDRLRAGYGKFYAPPRKATPQRPQAAQPPQNPPRKAPTAHQPKPSFPGTFPTPQPPPPSAGAHKYASYAKAGAQKWDRVYEDARTRAEAFRGFKDMKQEQQAPGGWTSFDPRTGRSSQHAEKPPMPRPQQPQKSQSAYHAFNAEAKESKTPQERPKPSKKKNGFAPCTPGGDEPMAKSTSAYFSASRADRPHAPNPPHTYYAAAPSPTAKKHAVPEQQPENIIPNLERARNTYASVGGERMYFSSTNLGRSSSVRESSGSHPRTNPPSQDSPTSSSRSRHHSASPKLKPDENYRSTSTSSSDTDEVFPNFRPKAVPRSRLAHAKANGKKSKPAFGEATSGWAMSPDSWLFTEAGEIPNQPAAHSDPDPLDSDANSESQGYESSNPSFKGGVRHEPLRPNPNPNPDYSIPRPGSTGGSKSTTGSNASGHRRASVTNMYDIPPKSYAQNWSEAWGLPWNPNFGGSLFPPFWTYHTHIPPHPALFDHRSAAKEQSNPAEHYKQFQPTSYPPYLSHKKTKADSSNRNSFDTASINLPSTKAPEGLQNAKSKSKSCENIDFGFRASEWNFAFGTSTGFTGPTSSTTPRFNSSSSASAKHSLSRAQSRSRATTGAQSKGNHAPQPPGQNAPAQPAKPFVPSTFMANQWAETMKSNPWPLNHTGPFQQQAAESQQRQESPKKQPKISSKRTTVPQPATISTEDDEAEATFAPESVAPRRLFGEEVDAMDLDSSPVGNRQGGSGLNNNGTQQAQQQPHITTGPKPNAPSNLFSMKNIGQVNPITATNSGGIADLKDLNTSLPFDSKPNNDNNTKLKIRPRDLALPKPPKPPSSPKFISVKSALDSAPQQVLTPMMWERYVVEMSTYMKEWNTFNKTMLDHFNARQTLVETALAPGWMTAIGDSTRLNLNDDSSFRVGNKRNSTADDDSDNETSTNTNTSTTTFGFGDYLRGIEEDFVVRQHWEVALERHRDCILELGKVRDWLRSGGKIHQATGTEQGAN